MNRENVARVRSVTSVQSLALLLYVLNLFTPVCFFEGKKKTSVYFHAFSCNIRINASLNTLNRGLLNTRLQYVDGVAKKYARNASMCLVQTTMVTGVEKLFIQHFPVQASVRRMRFTIFQH